jgi:hypothetical protein
MSLSRWLRGGANFNASLPTRVRRLEQQMRYVMAQIDDLNSGLQTVLTEVEAVLQHQTDLEQELTAQQNNATSGQPVDLSQALGIVGQIRQRLEGAASAGHDVVQPQPVDPNAPSSVPDQSIGGADQGAVGDGSAAGSDSAPATPGTPADDSGVPPSEQNV